MVQRLYRCTSRALVYCRKPFASASKTFVLQMKTALDCGNSNGASAVNWASQTILRRTVSNYPKRTQSYDQYGPNLQPCSWAKWLLFILIACEHTLESEASQFYGLAQKITMLTYQLDGGEGIVQFKKLLRLKQLVDPFRDRHTCYSPCSVKSWLMLEKLIVPLIHRSFAQRLVLGSRLRHTKLQAARQTVLT